MSDSIFWEVSAHFYYYLLQIYLNTNQFRIILVAKLFPNAANSKTKEYSKSLKLQSEANTKRRLGAFPDTSKLSQSEFLITNAPSDLRGISFPGGAVALALLLTARLISALWGHIADCDETYNYWEPLHYLVYGNGLQTWEYSPVYAIRSYMPLWMLTVTGKMLSKVLTPVGVFYGLRVLLAIVNAITELIFYKSVCHEFGVHVGRVWLCLTLPAAGCFALSAAMLPSAWSSAFVSLALASWWRRRYGLAVFFTAATSILCWPFTALIGLPIAIDLLVLKRLTYQFFKGSFISLNIFLLPTIAMDSWHYGKLVVAPWNIVAYNIFTEHGPDLYGVEPWTYYFVNGFLNFNIVWILALSCPLLLLACAVVSPRSIARASFCVPYTLGLMPLYLWLVVFMVQPHKEERFLYPVYNLIVLAGAIALDCLQKITFGVGTDLFSWHKMRERRHYLVYTGPLMIMCVLFAGVVNVSRVYSLYTNYHAPMTILSHLPPVPDVSNPRIVCFGKDWYRSPSSFHLPDGYRIRFIQSDFNGQLPAPYSEVYNGTRIIHPHFNDLNKGDNRTYLQPSQCHYLVESDIDALLHRDHRHKDDRYKDYRQKNNMWQTVAVRPMLHSEGSPRFWRAFYLPAVSPPRLQYTGLVLRVNRALQA